MKKKIVGCLLGLVLVGIFGAGETAWAGDKAILSSIKINNPPVIDGKLDDLCWQKVSRVGNFVLNTGDRLAREQTQAYVAYDNDKLYIAFKCYESQIRKMKANIKKHDKNVSADDSVEVFLDTNFDRKTYYHLMVNSLGTRYEEIGFDPSAWNGEWEAAATVGKNYWAVEMAIPFKSLGLTAPKEGDIWGFNLNREEQRLKEYSGWSPSYGSFHTPASFGRLVFREVSPRVKVLSSPSDLTKKNEVEVSVGGKVKAVDVRVKLLSPGGEVQTTSKKVTLPRPSWESRVVSLSYSLGLGKHYLSLAVIDPDTKEIYYRSPPWPLEGTGVKLQIDALAGKVAEIREKLESFRPSIVKELVDRVERVSRKVKKMEDNLEESRAEKSQDEIIAEIEKTKRMIDEINIKLLVLRSLSPKELRNSPAERRPYLLYVKPPFSIVYPDTLPEKRDLKKKISIFASPDEYEPATFTACTGKELKGVKVEVSDLRMGREAIPKDNIDLYVMKVWYQAGSPNSNMVSEPHLMPELLLKDDSLITLDKVKKRNILHFKKFPPDFKKLQPVDIPANSSKEFWMIVRVPEGTKAGVYRGRIKFSPQNAPPRRLTLEVNVLPIKLKKPKINYSIYYYTNAKGMKPGSIEEKRYLNELKDMKEHGFTSAFIAEGVNIVGKGKEQRVDFKWLKKALDLRVEAGLTAPTVFQGFCWQTPATYQIYRKQKLSVQDQKTLNFLVSEINKFVKENRYPELIFYGVDEPFTEKRLEQAINLDTALKKAGAKVAEAVMKTQAEKLGSLLDIPIYWAPDAYALFKGKRVVTPKTEFWYWHPLENPNVDRLSFGLITWQSGYEGTAPFAYRYFGTYNDWGNWESGVPWKAYRPEDYTYPSRTGVVPTIQWEAARAGIDDVRYLTTLDKLIKESKRIKDNPELVKEREASIRLIESIPDRFGSNNPEVLFKTLKPGEIQAFRWEVARMIIELQKLMNSK